MRKIIFGELLCLLFAAIASLPAYAADNAVAVDPVIITATRTAETVDESLSSVTVITRADIERLQPHSLQDLLVGVSGISIANTGGLGKTTSVFLRGTDSDQLLVLLDGVKIGSATTGTTAFEQIPVDLIDHIEIVRGPRSSLYGSEAIGGVIQIFTRKGAAQFTPNFDFGGGSHSTYQGSAGVAGSVGNAWYTAGVSGLDTAGIRSCNGFGAPTYVGCFTNDVANKDGYNTTAGLLRAGYHFGDHAEISAEWLRAYGNTQFDGSSSDDSKVVQQVFGANIKLMPLSFWQTMLNVGQSEDLETDFYQGTYADTFNSIRNSVSWQNDFQLAPHQQISVGGDYLKDHINSDTTYTVTSREDLGGFVQYQGGFGRSDVQLSARADHDQQFGGHTTGSAAYGYSFAPSLRVAASYGTAYRAPTFNELYYPDYGLPDLKPEKSRSAELGLSGHAPVQNVALNWSLNAYETFVDDLITYDAATGGPANVDRARIQGIEAQLGATWHQWRAHLNLDYVDARNRSQLSSDQAAAGDSDEFNHLLPRRAPESAGLAIDRDLDHHFSVGGTLYAAQRRFDDLDNTTPLGGYATLDLRAGWQFLPCWLLLAQINNVFDKDYETAAYYNQLGRTYFLNLRYHPN